MAECNDTIIVTGSTGFIGSALIKKLARRFALVGFDRVTTHRPQPTVDCVYIDLASEDSIAAGPQRVRTAYGSRIASVIHLAAYFDLTGEPNPLYDEIMTEVEFFHRASRTLVLTDLLANPEPGKVNRPLLLLLKSIGGISPPHGGVSRDMRLNFTRRHRGGCPDNAVLGARAHHLRVRPVARRK